MCFWVNWNPVGLGWTWLGRVQGGSPVSHLLVPAASRVMFFSWQRQTCKRVSSTGIFMCPHPLKFHWPKKDVVRAKVKGQGNTPCIQWGQSARHSQVKSKMAGDILWRRGREWTRESNSPYPCLFTSYWEYRVSRISSAFVGLTFWKVKRAADK